MAALLAEETERLVFAAPVRPAFLTQAWALASKNTTYQRKNLCAATRAAREALRSAEREHFTLVLLAHALTPFLSCSRTNCCLVLTPLVFSIVLGGAAPREPDLPASLSPHASRSSDKLPAEQPRLLRRHLPVRLPVPGLQRGQRDLPSKRKRTSFAAAEHPLSRQLTRCAQYTTEVTDPVFNRTYVVWNTNSFDFTNERKCTGGFNKSLCGYYYSEDANLPFCAITNPQRGPVLLQTPVPPFRPTAEVLTAAATGIPVADNPVLADDAAYNETYADGGDGGRGTFVGSRPSPFLFTGSGSAAAQQLASAMLYNANSTTFLDTLPQQLVESLAGNPLDVRRVNEIFASANFSRYFPLGSAAKQQQGSLQTDNAWYSLFMYLNSDCTALTQGEHDILDLSLYGIPVVIPCVSMPAVQVASAETLYSLLFSGYGKGAPGSLGERGNISAYPFALDVGAATDPAAFSLSATLLYNGTVIGATGQPLNAFFRTSAAMNRLSNAFLAAAIPNGANSPRATMRYVRDMPSQGLTLHIDIGEFLGPLFYTWLAQLLFPVMVGLLVYEKEKNLRTMMRVQGLGDGAYMLVNYGYYFLLYLAYLMLVYFYGAVLGFATDSLSLWTRSTPGPIVLFFALFANVQISMAFLFQALFTNAKTATVFAIVFLLVTGLLGAYLFQPFLEAESFARSKITAMELIIPFALYRGFYEMSAFGGAAATYPRGQGDLSVGISWAKIGWSVDQPGGMSRVMVIFLVESLFIHALAYYLDQVYSSGSGVKRHPLFFLDSCMRGQLAERQARAAAELRVAEEEAAATAGEDEPDVVACRELAYRSSPAQAAILARGLCKIYPGQDGAPPKVACRELSVAMPGSASGCWAPTGRASPPPSTCSSASSPPPGAARTSRATTWRGSWRWCTASWACARSTTCCGSSCPRASTCASTAGSRTCEAPRWRRRARRRCAA